MILVLTLFYVAVLQILVKLKILSWNIWTGLSIVAWSILLLIGLFIPMQFAAPGGQVAVMRYTVSIVPNVGGLVVDIPAEPNKAMKKGDVLFQIDPIPYHAALEGVEAQLELAKIQLEQAEELAERSAGKQINVDIYSSQVKQFEAGLKSARFKLDSTTVRAPADGHVTNVALRKGAMTTQFPAFPAMTFVDTSQTRLIAQIPEAYARHLKAGQAVEVALKYYPGKILTGTVHEIVLDNALGQVAVSGSLAAPRQVQAGVFFALIDLDDEAMAAILPTGATGEVAIYTEVGGMTHVIRKVMIRMTAYLNYINPF